MKRVTAVLLALILAVALCVPAFAAGRREMKKYEVYTCLGDSIAAGMGQPKVEGEDPFAYTGENVAAHIAALYDLNSTIIYRGYKPEVVPTAYPTLVADALGAKLNICARSAMRAYEMRYMLTGEYLEPDPNHSWGNQNFDHDNNGFSLSDLDYVNDLYQFRDKIAEADIITIALGSNDVLAPTFGSLKALVLDDDNMEDVVKETEAADSASALYEKVSSLTQNAGKYAGMAKNLVDVFNDNLDVFMENFRVIIDKIYELNPDVTILCVSVTNPFNNMKITADSNLPLDIAAKPFVDIVNNYFRSLKFVYGNSFIYVDVTDTPLYEAVISDPDFASYAGVKIHPTTAGHQYMAKKILDKVPGYSTGTSSRDALRAIGTTIITASMIHMAVQK